MYGMLCQAMVYWAAKRFSTPLRVISGHSSSKDQLSNLDGQNSAFFTVFSSIKKERGRNNRLIEFCHFFKMANAMMCSVAKNCENRRSLNLALRGFFLLLLWQYIKTFGYFNNSIVKLYLFTNERIYLVLGLVVTF